MVRHERRARMRSPAPRRPGLEEVGRYPDAGIAAWVVAAADVLNAADHDQVATWASGHAMPPVWQYVQDLDVVAARAIDQTQGFGTLDLSICPCT